MVFNFVDPNCPRVKVNSSLSCAVILFFLAILLPILAYADRVIYKSKLFSICSENKIYEVRIIPSSPSDYRNPKAIIKNNKKRAESTREVILVNDTPSMAFISNNGVLVTVEDGYHQGYFHVVVIYDQKGKLIKDYKLGDILSDIEIAKYVLITVSNRWWLKGTDKSSFRFSEDNNLFIIETAWGKLLKFDLETGDLK